MLVAGGANGVTGQNSAELYDPDNGTWSATGNMTIGRSEHSAVLLNSGDVLVAQGYNGPWQGSAELYHSDTGKWTASGSLHYQRFGATMTLLDNGKVLIEGGLNGIAPELYDPSTGVWNIISTPFVSRWDHTATLLNDGTILLAGGEDSSSPPSLASTELATLIPSHTFTGTLTLPSGWANGDFNLEFTGFTSTLDINAGALSNDGNSWGSWIAAKSNIPSTTTWSVSGDGANMPVYLRLRDITGQVTMVVQGIVNVDRTKPVSSMTQLPSFVGSKNVPLSWSGTDSLSGIGTYDVQVRAESDNQWTNLLTDTPQTSCIFNGDENTTYYFRVRAKDIVGNVEEWREPYDTSTVGTDYGISINNGNLFANSTNVVLTIAGKPGTSQMQVSNDGGFAGAAWEAYQSHKSWQIIPYGNYVIPRVVYVRYKDNFGNVSATYQDDIILDVTPPTGSVKIASGTSKQFANSEDNRVTLLLNATDDVSGVGGMMLSNHPGFSAAIWENYATTAMWTFDSNETVYAKFRDYAGNVSRIYSSGKLSNTQIYLPLLLR